MKTKTKVSPYPMYKDKPLVRCENTLYYGCISDGYVVKISVHEQEKKLDLNIASRLTIQLMQTENNSIIKIIKTSEKNNLYSALDIADAWLHRALENN